MSLVSTLLIALAMSTDAFAAAIGKGMALKRPHLSEALRAGMIFGIIEALTPLVGWALGMVAAEYVREWDHWIAFGLLLALGVSMIHSGLKNAEAEPSQVSRHSFWLLAATGFATSIDAMAVGVTLAFVDNNILITAAVIGFTTLLMVTLGVMIGRWIGVIAGRWAEVLGGLALIGIGTTILYEHLMV